MAHAINESLALRHLQRVLGPIYSSVPVRDYIQILEDETLFDFSLHYPEIIRDIRMTKSNGIQERHPSTKRLTIRKYRVPNTSGRPFIGISNMIHPYNYDSTNIVGNYPRTPSLIQSKYNSARQQTSVRYVGFFHSPDIISIRPTPNEHVDFVISMQRVRMISEIPPDMRRQFIRLFEFQVKDYLYNKFRHLTSGGTIGGVEISLDAISDYSGAADTINEIMERFQEDSFMHPERYEELTAQLGWG